MDLLHDCLLVDQAVVDKKIEIFKCDRKIKLDELMNRYEEITKEKGHCNDDGKLDGSMKAHYRRFLMCFDTTKHGKCINNYFDKEQH